MIRSRIEIAVGVFFLIFVIILSKSSTEVQQQDLHRTRILNSLFEVIIVCDTDGKVVYASDNLEDHFGWCYSDIKQQGINTLMVSDHYAKQHDSKFKEAARLAKNRYLYANKPMRRCVPIKCKDETIKQAAIRMFAADIDGTVFLYATILPLDVFDTVKSWPTPSITE